MTEDQAREHNKIDTLLEQAEHLSKIDIEKAREKVLIALNIIKREHKKTK